MHWKLFVPTEVLRLSAGRSVRPKTFTVPLAWVVHLAKALPNLGLTGAHEDGWLLKLEFGYQGGKCNIYQRL